MSKRPSRWAAELLQVWFHDLSPSDWFGQNGPEASDTVDQMLRIKFERKLVALGGERPDHFTGNPKVAQAAILLFDQVPRNIYRGDPRAFATDPLARELCKAVIAKGWDTDLSGSERQFIAMPLMHSEDVADQAASVAYFAEHLPDNLGFAKSHHEMIARFGRFPHRNTALGRETAEAEQAAIDEGFSW